MKRSLALLAVLAAGCSGYALRKPIVLPLEPFGGVASDLAQICVMRPHWVAWAVTAVVRDNGELVGATRGDTYFCYMVEPGRHSIVSATEDGSDEAMLEAHAGVRYYLHQRIENYIAVVRTRLSWVDETEARRLVAKCGYREIAGVPGKESIPNGAPVASLR
jgi:hypothetical protein